MVRTLTLKLLGPVRSKKKNVYIYIEPIKTNKIATTKNITSQNKTIPLAPNLILLKGILLQRNWPKLMRGRQFTCPDQTHLNLRTWPLPHFNIELLSSVHSARDSLPHPAAQVVRLRDGVRAQEARQPTRRADQSWWDESWSYWMEANGSEPTVPRG